MTENEIVQIMISMYCRRKHGNTGSICSECKALLVYSWKRIDACPHKGHRTTCAACKTHCYRPEMREKVRAVMRFSGPRMIFLHPPAVLSHLFGRLAGKR